MTKSKNAKGKTRKPSFDVPAKTSVGKATRGMASRSQHGRFAHLQVDDIVSSDEEESDRPTSASPSTTPAARSYDGPAPGEGVSKKALARRRAALRKKTSSTNLLSAPTSGTESEAAAPAPSLKTFIQKVEGKTKEAIKKDEIRVPALGSFGDVKKEEIKPASAPTPAPPPKLVEPEEATSSEAESVPGGDETSEDEEEEIKPSSPTIPQHPPSPTTASTLVEKPVVYTGADHDPNKKISSIITRTTWGLFMIFSFIFIVCMGQVYVIFLVFIIQALVFGELTGLFDAGYAGTHNQVEVSKEREERRRGRREERDRWSRRMSWYFFAATNYFLYGESLIYYFKHILTLRNSFLPSTFSFAQHHRLISFGLYIIGFVSFVANLRRTQLRRQFGLFGWIHMSLLLIVVSSHFIVNNILEGLIWFWQPVSLVIMNDIAAYACGMLFGRHQLIKLSPKKTVEGFVGAFFVTILFSVLWGTFFMRFNYFICPMQDLAMNAFSDITCTPNHVFVWRSLPVPQAVQDVLRTLTGYAISSIPWAPFQLHSIVMAVFASLVAPFGGFFASGFKRGFGIKDFGASIPGHGGMTDRMDCQFLMGLFSYVYYASIIRETHVSVGSVLATAMGSLSTTEQTELVKELIKVLGAKGVAVATTLG